MTPLKPMPGLSVRAQEMLTKKQNGIVIGPRNNGIPQAMRTTKEKK
jgi:hypothetical protein